MSEHRIVRLGHHGDGIADGPVFAPVTLPDEVVSGRLDGDQLREIRIVEPSSQRVAPPCRHFKSCGGCQLQHAADGFVAGWKLDIVQGALNAQGAKTEFRPIVTSPARSRRRATFAARRTKKDAMAGFFGRGSDIIVEIPGCQLLLPQVMEGLPIARRLALIGASRKAPLAVSVTASDAGLDVSVTGGKPLDGPLQQKLAQLTEAMGMARLTWDGEVIAMRAPPRQSFGRARVTPPPAAFLQATCEGEAALCDAVRAAVGSASRIADLFAGCGTFSLPLADSARVHAVEGDTAMLDALADGWRNAAGLKPITVEPRDLFRRPLLRDELARFDAVVVDPPRAGASAQVAELAASEVPRIAYVSCNPVTYARDAAVLAAAGFDLRWVQVVDQFRWSAHTELVSCFVRSV